MRLKKKYKATKMIMKKRLSMKVITIQSQNLKLVKRICKLTQMWTMEALKKIMEAMNISFVVAAWLSSTLLLFWGGATALSQGLSL